jgi:hypothetical protein
MYWKWYCICSRLVVCVTWTAIGYDKDLKVVEVSIDSEAVIKSIRNKETVSASGRGLVQRILQLLE